MVRNLKNTLVSLHNFHGAAIDGMLGNDLGLGSIERFVNINGCTNVMGSALGVYYEQLVRNFVGEVHAVNNFLGLALLTDARVQLIEGVCGLRMMRKDAGFWMRYNCPERGGGIGGTLGSCTTRSTDRGSRTSSIRSWGGGRSRNLTLAVE